MTVLFSPFKFNFFLICIFLLQELHICSETFVVYIQEHTEALGVNTLLVLLHNTGK